MKKTIVFSLFLIFILLFSACAAEAPTQAQPPAVSEVQTQEPAVLQPLDSAPLDFSDGIFHVSFDPSDLAKTDDGYTLTAEVFAYDLYDAVEVQLLDGYESIVVCGERIGIDAVNVLDSGLIEINGGLGEGICLSPNGGGTYRTTSYNGYPLYFPAGSVTLPLSEDVRVIDLSRHDETAGITDEALYPAEAISGYAELEQTITEDTLWWEGATSIRTEGGKIVNITRIWTP